VQIFYLYAYLHNTNKSFSGFISKQISVSGHKKSSGLDLNFMTVG